MNTHMLAVVVSVAVLLGLATLPIMAMLSDPPLDDLPAPSVFEPEARDVGDEQEEDPSVGGAGVEGPSGGIPVAPAEDASWGRERGDFTGGSASTVRSLAITEDNVTAEASWKAFDGNPTKLFDLDGNGQKEIIVQNDNHWTYVFDSKDGTLLAELPSKVPSYWEARSFNGPEAAVLERDGAPHIVTANSAAVVTAHAFSAENSTSKKMAFDKVWSVRLDACHEDPGMDAKVTLADLDLDSDLEILAATEERGLYALEHDGTLLWKNCMNGGNAAPVVADVTADGWPDVVHVSDGGVVSLLDGRTGEWRWTYEVSDDFDLGSGSIPVAPAVGDLTDDPGLEIVFGARDSHDAKDWDEDHAILVALDSKGGLLWSFQDPNGNPLTYTRPIMVDADRDGTQEVYWADWNTVGHNPPSKKSPMVWNRTGPANYYRLDADGGMVWNRSLETWWNNKDLALADLDGDGGQELMANGPDEDGTDGIWYLDVATGEKKAWVPLGPWKAQRAPVVGDLWGTGTTQWVIQAAPNEAGTGPAILVYDAQVPYDAAWPHLPEPVLDAPFNVTFDKVQGNGHWVGVKAHPSGDRIDTMAMRIDGGEWTPMTEEGWGWSRSTRIPDGATVQFQATGVRGDAVTSDCYRWPAIEPMECPKASALRT